MKKIKPLLFIIMFIALQGCATADMRSKSLKNTGQNETLVNKGQWLLQQATWRQDLTSQWDRYDEWKIVTRDVWKANLVRRLTPITQADQKVEFNFQLNSDQAEMKYLDGIKESQILGIDNGESYNLVDGERIINDDNKIKLYLAPVRDYFFWPQELVNSEFIIYEGEDQIKDQAYHKVFVTNGSIEPSPENDQYIVWINKKNMKIDLIEFTLRDLLKSYRGVVEYADYREVQGMFLPHQILLKDKVGVSKHSHQFLVEDMRFKKKQNDLSFIISIKPVNTLKEKPYL